MNAGEPDPTGQGLGELLYRKERRYFRGSTIFMGLSIVVWISMQAYGWLTMRKVAAMMGRTPEPDIDELSEAVSESRGIIMGMGILLLVLLIAFLGYFVAWLVAIRRRRKAFEGLPPTR